MDTISLIGFILLIYGTGIGIVRDSTNPMWWRILKHVLIAVAVGIICVASVMLSNQ